MEGRKYHKNRQRILQYFYNYNKLYYPDIVFVPSRNQVHQDHEVVTNEAIRAFKDSTILGYNHHWSQTTIVSNYIVSLENDDVHKKWLMLDSYESRNHNFYFDHMYQLAIVILNGVKVEGPYAETFEVIKIIEGKII